MGNVLLPLCLVCHHIRTAVSVQVKSGTIFDNFLITDDETYAEEVGNETWGETKDPEKKMKEAVSAFN